MKLISKHIWVSYTASIVLGCVLQRLLECLKLLSRRLSTVIGSATAWLVYQSRKTDPWHAAQNYSRHDGMADSHEAQVYDRLACIQPCKTQTA